MGNAGTETTLPHRPVPIEPRSCMPGMESSPSLLPQEDSLGILSAVDG